VRGTALIDLHANLAAGIEDADLAQRALHEDDEGDDGDHHDNHAQDHRGRQRAGPALGKELRNGGRNLGHDTDEDDERNAVADAARGDLLAQPHQEHGAADQRDDAGGDEKEARAMRQPAGLDGHGNPVALQDRQRHGPITGVLVQLLAALLTLFAQLLPRAVHRAQKLHDDRGTDIGHDPEGKDAHRLTARRR
jgi:hypothetical protein